MFPTHAQRLARAATALAPVSETPRLDAEWLLAHALGMSRSRLLARLHECGDAPGFDALVARRLEFEPIPYILGTWEFFSLEFVTRAPVLVPRPETEGLAEAALAFFAARGAPSGEGMRVLDLCTGSGCIAIAIQVNAPRARVIAADRAPHAIALAGENIARHQVPIALYEGDLFDALPAGEGPFDLIVSNPPYVETGEWETLSPTIRRYEDPSALLAGEDGLALLERIVAEAPAWLRPGGMLAVEMGEKHGLPLRQRFAAAGFSEICVLRDLGGFERIAQGRMA